MSRMLPALAVAVSAVLIPLHVEGQRQTEIYIPIGQSPGVSSTTSYIGTVTKVEPSKREFSLEVGGSSHIVMVTDKTRIWLDRSKQKLKNQVGQISDLQVGRTVEVKYSKPGPQVAAEWIKIQVAG